ncbi:MAG: VWA domain-containing protein, partial [Kiritimatiellae bacterium]|nr:VWA domain-containing protein [Kiritimatiellia bacterium]
MSFANPWLLLFALPLAFAAWRLLRYGRRSGIRFSALSRLPAKTAGWRARVAATTPFILLAGLALLVVAAARPRTPILRASKNIDAIAIVMTVDISGSMAILDLAPQSVLSQIRAFERSGRRLTPDDLRKLKDATRLAEVKRLFADFVDKRPDDLIGLVTFGGYAETRAPLTADHKALRSLLAEVEIPTGREETMTAIGDGLGMALSRLENAVPESKIVILLSDGVNNSGAVTPEAMTEVAARRGVKVYAIGVGTTSHYMPVVGNHPFGWKYIGQASDSFDEAQLKGIAKKTGGKYFAVNDSSALKEALEEIDRLETTPMEADVRARWN